MPLPELIEIVPLKKLTYANVLVPGSKSITNRALILAALGNGETRLTGALWSEDTEIMVNALRKLKFEIKVSRDPNESCNRVITVKGLGGRVPGGGTKKFPVELFVGNAGTAARFLAALVCLGQGVYKLSGVERMNQRPQAALFNAIAKPAFPLNLLGHFFPGLSTLGYKLESNNGKLPVTIYGRGPKPGKCTVNIEESSQFASALLLCAKAGGWKINIVGENAEESPYVVMTRKLIEAFKTKDRHFRIESDASGGSYFWSAGWLFPGDERLHLERDALRNISRYDLRLKLNGKITEPRFFSVQVLHWPDSRWQIDEDFPLFLEPSKIKTPISRIHHLGDSIMSAIAIAPFATEPCTFIDLGRLRLQETERVAALKTELTKCGARVVEEGDTLTVYPSKLHGAEIETYNDHRMAMCFAILGLKVPGIKLKNPSCVKKTFPNFFQKLAAAPPSGLGATILDGKIGRKLTGAELFAD